MTDVEIGWGDPAPSDAELILGVRGGDLDAYGALYERHAAAARRLARQFLSSPNDAEDVVADAFARVLAVLRGGGGPDSMFRAYLFTVVRNVAAEVGRRDRRLQVTDDDACFEAAMVAAASPEDPALDGFEQTVVAQAYRSLPERWQAVLWYTEVERIPPAQVAPILGLTANGVSALAYRAREALRVGYLQQHLSHAPTDSCRDVNALLGGYVRGSLAKREVGKVEAHLETCGDCRSLVLELSDVAHGMRGVIAPLVLGVAGLGVLGALPVGLLAGAGAGAAAGAAGGSVTVGAAAGAGTAAASTATASTAVAAVVGGSSVAAAGAVAVAAVGVGVALSMGSGAELPHPAVPSAVVVDRLGDGVEDGRLGTVPAGLELDATSPVNLLPATDDNPFVDPPDLEVTPVATGVMEPREPEPMSFHVRNVGGSTARSTTVRLELPEGLRPVLTQSPSGSSGAPNDGTPLSVEALTCTGTDAGDQVVDCFVGDVEPSDTETVTVQVEAEAGGTYDIDAAVWADGLAAAEVPLPPTSVDTFGAELTATVGSVERLTNPGAAWLPVTVRSTGDVAVPAGWSVVAQLPEGIVPVAVDGGLACTPGAGGLTCAPAGAGGAPLAPGDVVEGRLQVAATGTEEDAGVQVVSVRPVLPGSDHVRAATGTVAVAPAWADAASGVGGLLARCEATGGAGTGRGAVVGTWTNTTGGPVAVRLDAAGATSASQRVEPGEQVTVPVDGGLRVPAGTGTWTLAREVAGTTYTTTLPAGSHEAADCYAPAWDVDATVVPQNVDGQVRLVATVSNRTGEAMQAGMAAVGQVAPAVTLDAGETATLAVDTGSASVPAGEAELLLTRWTVDADGDEPAQAAAPAEVPTVAYRAAVLAPAADVAAAVAEECRYDPASETSTAVLRVPVDNSGSTLPVTFAAGDASLVVAAGERGTLEVPVAWGTTGVDVLADGRLLGTVQAGFTSCATVAWPQDVTVTATPRCTPGDSPAGRPELAVTLANDGGSTWSARVARGGTQAWTEAVTLTPGETREVVVSLGRWLRAPGGSVDVQLARTVEGTEHVATGSARFAGTSCVLARPGASLEAGEPEAGEVDGVPTSSRTVGVVLDNTASNVPVLFRVTDRDDEPEAVRMVAPGATTTVEVPRATGAEGAAYTVRAGEWSTTLTVEPFTAVGWCAAPWDAATEATGGYAPGDVVSQDHESYRYLGADGADGAATDAPAGPATPGATPGGGASTPAPSATTPAPEPTGGTTGGTPSSPATSTTGGTPAGSGSEAGSRAGERASDRARERAADRSRFDRPARGGGGGRGGLSRAASDLAVPAFGWWTAKPTVGDAWEPLGPCETR